MRKGNMLTDYSHFVILLSLLIIQQNIEKVANFASRMGVQVSLLKALSFRKASPQLPGQKLCSCIRLRLRTRHNEPPHCKLWRRFYTASQASRPTHGMRGKPIKTSVTYDQLFRTYFRPVYTSHREVRAGRVLCVETRDAVIEDCHRPREHFEDKNTWASNTLGLGLALASSYISFAVVHNFLPF